MTPFGKMPRSDVWLLCAGLVCLASCKSPSAPATPRTLLPPASASAAGDTPPVAAADSSALPAALAKLPTLPPPALPALPTVRAGRVANGGGYQVVARPGSLAFLQLRVAAGALHAAPGVAEATAATVAATKAAAGMPSVRERLAQLGGRLRYDVGASDTVFEVVVPSAQAARAADLLAQLVRRAALPAQAPLPLRDGVAARARVEAARGMRQLLLGALYRVLLGHGEPAEASAGSGTASEFAQLSGDMCALFYARHYGGPSLTLSWVGPDAGGAEAALKRALVQLPKHSVPEPDAAATVSGHPLRVVLLDVPAATRTRLLWASMLRRSDARWPSGAMHAQRLLEAALAQGAWGTERFERSEVLAWPGAGVLALWAHSPHDEVAAGALSLQAALRSLAHPARAPEVSALRARVALDAGREQQSGTRTLAWLRRSAQGLAARDDAQLRGLLSASPAALPSPGPEVLLAAGPARQIAEALRALGEVVVVDAANGFARRQAHMPAFDITHDEPDETQTQRPTAPDPP